MTTLSTRILNGNPDIQPELLTIPGRVPRMTFREMADNGHWYCYTCSTNFPEVDQRLSEVGINACPSCGSRHLHYSPPVPQPAPSADTVCAWCQREGKGPAWHPGQSHGICKTHYREQLRKAGINENE